MCLNHDAADHVLPAIRQIRGVRDPIRHDDPRDSKALGKLRDDIENFRLPEIARSWDEMNDHDKHVLLARMANFMDDLPSDRHVQGRWTADDATDTSCGTAGCFAGWTATVHGKHGWKFGRADSFGRPPIFRDKTMRMTTQEYVALFYAIPMDSAVELCHGRYSFPGVGYRTPTPREVAARIREVLRRIDPAALDEVDDPRPAEQAAQVSRTLATTRARMPELEDESGPCVLCGEAPCVCWTDPDNMRDRELDINDNLDRQDHQ